MSNKVIFRIVLLGAIAIIGIIAVQTYWVMAALDAEEREFHQKVNIALRKVAEDLATLTNKELPSIGLIKQHSNDTYVVNINSDINANNLEHYLVKELEAISLDESFEYGIFDCASDEFVYGNYIAKGSDKPERRKPTVLPKEEDLIYYFDVHFPNRSSYMLSNMWVPIVFSCILLLSIIFFITSMMVILKQKRLSEMQKDFINNMTHEFKTPLSTIKLSNNAFLKDEKIKADSRLFKYATIINDQNERLNNQVEKVLQLAKIEKEQFNLSPVNLNLHNTIQEVCRSVEPRISNASGELKMALGALDNNITADELHLTNVLYNLLDNAIKYCKKNPIVEIKTKNRDQYIELRIGDNGIGIEQENIKKVFEKFYRVPTGNVHDVKGFGLGLFYVKNICDAHNWKIRISSSQKAGSAVQILIPTIRA